MDIRCVTILGTGNVARMMTKKFSDKGLEIAEVWGRNPQKAAELAQLAGAKLCENIHDLKRHDGLYLIAVSDRAIPEVVNEMPKLDGLVAHVSGIAPLEWVSDKFDNAGVFYPLQTIHKDTASQPGNLVMIVEANSKENLEKLRYAAGLIATMQLESKEEQRRKLHLAAVMVNNFSNHLMALAKDYLQRNDLPADLLHPLIEQTALNAIHHDPAKIQTGPARRGDLQTIQNHIDLIRELDIPYLADIYNLLTASIQAYHRVGN